jgi:microcystin-dependent protein
MKKVSGALAAFLYSTSALWGATLLPNGQQQFVDATGKPYAAGKVYFYSNYPTCTVLKNTYQNEAGTQLNTNPIILDAAGRATIFGSGAYCQVLKDANNNTIWTKYTSDTSSASNLGWGGTSGGTANAQTVTVSAFSNVNGQTFYFKAGATNTSALTLTVNGGSAISVVRDTPTGTVALTGGEVVSGNIIGVTYDSGTGVFHLVTNNSRLFGYANAVPAAITMDLNASSSHVVNVTGSGVSISSFGAGGASAAANTIFFLQFNGTNTVVAGANITTPSGGNIVVSSGASLTVLYQGANSWRVLQVTGGSSSAIGQIAAFATSTCPTGWLKANGATPAQATYPGLYAAIGTTWGPAAAGNVTLPDFRGMFLRGITDGRATDPNGGALTAQALAAFVDDQFESHTHTYTAGGSSTIALSAGGVPVNQSAPSSTNTGATGGTETNPKNEGVLYCIQY